MGNYKQIIDNFSHSSPPPPLLSCIFKGFKVFSSSTQDFDLTLSASFAHFEPSGDVFELRIFPSRGTIVKARDKLYHPECFMCDDCGINLKQRGYFFIEDNLYCETHAKARVQPPEGYDVVAVYPNSKVEIV